MTQNYLSGRVNRFAVGVPGFSTSGDLTLDVSGALGIGTTQPRCEADVPNISVREQILDSSGEAGPLGYFLSADGDGVRWVAASPQDLTFIRVYDNGAQPGFSSVSGLNFVAEDDDDFIKLEPNSFGDPNVVDIKFDVRWVKNRYGNNFGIATGFGTDGTYASIPGYGTSEAAGITSVGIGTNQPQDDLQVGIGSTGVTLNGPTGTVKAVTGSFKNLRIDGNISAESLLIDPGLSTFRGPIDAQGIATFSDGLNVISGVASIADLRFDSGIGSFFRAGIATLGVGVDTTTFTVVENSLQVNGITTLGDINDVKTGLTTITGDLYVGKDFFVGGELFVKQLNAENAQITGIATINNIDGNVGVFTGFQVNGIATLAQVGFDTAIGGEIDAGQIISGILTATDLVATAATIGFASITDAVVGGSVTATRVDVEQVEIDRAQVGILTVNDGFVNAGLSTLVGFTTFGGDIYVAGFGTFGKGVDIPFVQVEDLIVSGIATVAELDLNVGIASTLYVADLGVGIGTFEELSAESGDVGGVDFEGGGEISGTNLDFDTGRIGILTGDNLVYQIGTITEFDSRIAGIDTLSGQNLQYTGLSQINGVTFDSDQVEISQNLGVSGIVTLGRPDIDPKVGLTTVSGDLYVGNDLFVAGELNFEQLTGENLFLSGIATINQVAINTGISTFIQFEGLEVTGIATVETLLGVAGTITDLNTGTLINDSTIRTRDLQVERVAQVGSQLFAPIVSISSFLSAPDTEFTGISTIADAKIAQEDVGISTIRDLTVTGIATVNELDVDNIIAGVASIGIATIGDLLVTGVTTFQSRVNIDDIVFINQEVTGISTVNVGIFTDLSAEIARIDDANIGVATVGLVSATSIEVEDLEAGTARIGVSTTGYAVIGTGATTDGALLVTGVSSFVGYTTFFGNVTVGGGLTVTGITSFNQLDAKQSQIGILTVGKLDSNGEASFENVAISTGLEVTGITTLGFTTTGDLIVGSGLTVYGRTEFLGIVSITETSFVNQEVTGISTVNNLFFNVGVGTQLDVGILTARDANVSGIATFDGDIDINADVDISGKLTAGELGVSGLSTFTDINVSSAATIGFASITSEVVGFSTIGVASIGTAEVGVATIGLADIQVLELDNLLVNGISTFIGVATFSDIEYRNASSSGISTLNEVVAGVASLAQARIGLATLTDAIIGFASVGFSTIGIGSTTDAALFVTGVSTFSGVSSFFGNMVIDGDLRVTGFASYNQLDAKQSNIGILTVGTDLDVDGTFSVVGFSTLGDFSANSGVVTFLDAEDVNVSGSLTAVELDVTDLEVQRNLLVGGITTLGGPTPAGFTTTLGDLYVGGDLFVKDDIFYDEIVGRNLFITGIGTINDLIYNVGIGTSARIEELTASIGEVTSISGLDATYEAGEFDSLQAGISTFTGPTEFQDRITSNSDIFTSANIEADNLTVDNTIRGNIGILSELTVERRLNSNGLAIFNNVRITGVTTANGHIDARSTSLEVGIATITELFGANVTSSGIITGTNIYASNLIEAATSLASKGTLTVDGQSTFRDDITLTSDVDLTVTQGDIRIVDGTLFTPFIDADNADVGILTALSIEANFVDIEGGLDVISGISSFNNAVYINDNLFVEQNVFAPAGIFTSVTVRGSLVGNTGIFTGQLQTEDIFTAGIITATDGKFQSSVDTPQLSAGLATATQLDAPVANIDTLNVNAGFATDFTAEDLTVTGQTTVNDLNITGVSTAQQLNIENGSISGILTVNQQIDHTPDATSTDARRSQTTSVAPGQVLYPLPAGYTSAEFTVTAVEGTNFHTTKIHALNTGTGVFFNEYSNVFNNIEVGQYDVVLNAGGMDLVVEPASANTTNFTVHVIAHKA